MLLGRQILGKPGILLATLETGITNLSITVMHTARCISINMSWCLACVQVQLLLTAHLSDLDLKENRWPCEQGAQSTYSAPKQLNIHLSTPGVSSRKTAKEESASFSMRGTGWILDQCTTPTSSYREKEHVGLMNTSGNLGGTRSTWTPVSGWKCIKWRKGTLGWIGKLMERVATAIPPDCNV